MNILLAEDDHHVSEIMKICLESIGGHFVVSCDDGAATLATLETRSFDLVILDGMMPKKNGLQVAREMRALGRPEPIIFLSAKSDEKDIKEFLSLASGYIAKPFDPQTICQRIEAILSQPHGTKAG